MANLLIHQTSPYLLQHAHQPVNWFPYSENVFEMAKEQDKPLIISIGYSTCHWCHVMAHECFDDIEVANLMNKYFISVKVDREELPDVDKYYMNAIQVLTGRGGWPLNAFVLPNKKPFYAVTYLPKHQWMTLLNRIHSLYINEKIKLEEYAENIHNGIKHFELAGLNQTDLKKEYNTQDLEEVIYAWKSLFDKEWGGHTRVPKFVMPVNYKFLLTYVQFINDEEVKNHIQKSIQHIALGGLFDIVGGGFYRYSTDRYWKIPHFEKMLYDNAQMIELLSLYQLKFPSDEIKWILEKNIQCVLRDFYSNEQLFYSAWDADSEGKEGKFYTWTIDELKNILHTDFDEFANIFNISNNFGYWENDKYVLTINIPLFKQDRNYWIVQIDKWINLLFKYRQKRIPPSIDTKIITSWNSLMIKALCTASLTLQNQSLANIAEKSLGALLNKVWKDEKLYRIYKDGQTKIDAYLDDYAFLIEALITLSKITANTDYLLIAQKLLDKAVMDFYSPAQRIFYYTTAYHSQSNTIELYDDVIPSANAQMIKNLIYLGHVFSHSEYLTIAEEITKSCAHLFFKYPQNSVSYGFLILEKLFFEKTEVTIVGKNASDYLQKIFPQTWFINTIYTSAKENDWDIFKNRFHSQKTFIYVCRHSTCYESIETPINFNITNYIQL